MNFEAVKILVVDDEEVFTSILEHILKPVYTVFVANSGQRAIEIAQEIVPDLILLDVVMPDISGFEVFAQLRNIDVTQSIPVIFITGLNNNEDEEKGFFLGAVDYITKPFYNPIVMARVRTHVEIIRHLRTIEHMCMIDALTNLSNRRGFDNRLDSEWGRAMRTKEPISLLFIDIDNFKHYNDTYGHPFGDMLIQNIAGILKQNLKRSADFPSRWGGDEFVALLPNTDFRGVYEIAEKIRANVERTLIPTVDGVNVSMTVSIGVNSIIPTENDTIANFLEETDQKLYAAKKAGKNRLVIDEKFGLSQQDSLLEDDRSQQAEPEPKSADLTEKTEFESGTDNAALSKFTSLLKDIPMLNVEQAVAALGGSEELYEKIISLAVSVIPEDVEQMQKSLFEDNDLNTFGIKVHGVKGYLNQIGYKKPAAVAESLEKAAKAGDGKYCRENYEDFHKQILQFANQVNAAALSEENDYNKVLTDINDFSGIIQQAKVAIEDFDSVLAVEILSPLSEHYFGGEPDKLLSNTINALDHFQAQQALEYILELEQKYLA